MAQSEVAGTAERLGLPTAKPASLKSDEAREAILRCRPDVMVVAAYGLLLPAEVLRLPVRGCLNIHASLLPRWRGAAPIQRAILVGDAQTGITIMRMDEGLDTGPVLLQRAIDIAPRETAGSLTQRLSNLGAECIVAALESLDQLVARPQDGGLATYAAKVSKPEARIDWSHSAVEIDRQVRAFNPYPGAETRLADETIKIWEARPCPGRGTPGAILEAGSAGVVVASGEGALRLEVVQRAGGKRLPAAAFLRGYRPLEGEFLGAFAPAGPENPGA